MANFASRLKNLRLKNNLNQIDLAEELSFARTTIANYEQGIRFPSEKTLCKLANYFNVSLDYLLGQTNIENIYEHHLITKKGEMDNLETNNSFYYEKDKFLNLFESIINTLGSIVYLNNPFKKDHPKKVANLAYAIGKKMDLSSVKLNTLKIAGYLHDVGEINIPNEILNSPNKIRKKEVELVKAHPEYSYQILKDINFRYPVAPIALQHHERLDGSGYPCGLTKDKIHIEAKILAVADVVVAMSSPRPHRKSYSLNTTLKKLSINKGIKYDSTAVSICLELFEKNKFRFQR